jgi:hypothetical protein
VLYCKSQSGVCVVDGLGGVCRQSKSRSHEQRLVTAGQGKRKVVTRTGGYAERVKADMQPYRSSQTTSSSLDKLPDVIQASRLNPDPEGMTKGRVTLGIIRYLNSPSAGESSLQQTTMPLLHKVTSAILT